MGARRLRGKRGREVKTTNGQPRGERPTEAPRRRALGQAPAPSDETRTSLQSLWTVEWEQQLRLGLETCKKVALCNFGGPCRRAVLAVRNHTRRGRRQQYDAAFARGACGQTPLPFMLAR